MLIKDGLGLLIKALHMLDLHLHPALCGGVHEQLIKGFLKALRGGEVLSQTLNELGISHVFVRWILAGLQILGQIFTKRVWLARESEFGDMNHLGGNLLNGDQGPLGFNRKVVEGLVCLSEVFKVSVGSVYAQQSV